MDALFLACSLSDEVSGVRATGGMREGLFSRMKTRSLHGCIYGVLPNTALVRTLSERNRKIENYI